jgi:tRNA U55 pseudouridine synthase TruB
LRRTLVGGPLAAATPVTLETLEALAGDEPALDRLLLPADAALTGLPAVTLAPESAARVGHGQRVDIAAGTPGRVRLYGSAGVFLGIGEVSGDGCTVRPIRLMPPAEPQPAR